MRIRRRRNQHLYTTAMFQSGGAGIPMYRARQRYMRGAGLGSFLKGAFRTLSKPIIKIGKEVIKDLAPDIAKTGAEVLSGQTTLKKAMRTTAKQAGKSLTRGTRKTLEKELDRLEKKQKGGRMMMPRGKSKMRGRKKKRDC